MSSDKPIGWYRTPLEKEVLHKLTERSDIRGFIQSSGFLGVMVLTGTLVARSAALHPWFVTVALLVLHGTVCAFCVNAMHELSHTTVFKNKTLNGFFLYLFSFIGWINPVVFKASHMKHHQFTLHPPRDLEVLPETYPSVRSFIASIIDPLGFFKLVRATFRHALGRMNSSWEESLFPTVESRRRVARWARILLGGHLIILTASLASGWWMIPVVVSLTPLYGRWLQFLCNETQHTGLPGNVPDWRICARSIKVNPAIGFLYWQMQYHIEHHMYASVPCYNLHRLSRKIRHDLPSRAGLIRTWMSIRRDPSKTSLVQ
jgi:fatty acid desaturase